MKITLDSESDVDTRYTTFGNKIIKTLLISSLLVIKSDPGQLSHAGYQNDCQREESRE